MTPAAVEVEGEELTVRSWSAIGTTATVVVQRADHVASAERILGAEIDAFDCACSRFRPDSELQSVHARGGQAVRVSAVLFEALEVACEVARRTSGAVDPTIGNAIAALGYDQDLSEVTRGGPSPLLDMAPAVGFAHIHLDRAQRMVRIPRGVKLDLGSSAKALIADRSAVRISEDIGAGALVSIGGDVAVAGPPPPDGWAIAIATASSTAPEDADHVVSIQSGGLASSSPKVRTWKVGDREAHHILDPRTGDCVSPYWSLVSVTGTSCVSANALSTAAVVWGKDALWRLPAYGQAVRLVRRDGEVFSLNGWPKERAA